MRTQKEIFKRKLKEGDKYCATHDMMKLKGGPTILGTFGPKLHIPGPVKLACVKCVWEFIHE